MSRYHIALFSLVLFASACGDKAPEEVLFDALESQFPAATHLDNPPSADEPTETLPVWDGSVVASSVSGLDWTPDSICLFLDESEGALCIPTDDERVRVSSAGINIEWIAPTDMCNKVGDGCKAAVLTAFAQNADGDLSEPISWTLATACDSCNNNSCAELVTSCEDDNFCLDSSDCADESSCLRGTCVDSGPLHFQMSWSEYSDLDLHVLTSSGHELYYGNRNVDSGYLDHDDTSGGPNSIENIVFSDPDSGDYQVWVELYSGPGGTYTLSAFRNGEVVFDRSGFVDSSNRETVHEEVSYPR